MRCSIASDSTLRWELELIGSHGCAAADFPAILELVRRGELRPDKLVEREVGLAEGAAAIEVRRFFVVAGQCFVSSMHAACPQVDPPLRGGQRSRFGLCAPCRVASTQYADPLCAAPAAAQRNGPPIPIETIEAMDRGSPLGITVVTHFS